MELNIILEVHKSLNQLYLFRSVKSKSKSKPKSKKKVYLVEADEEEEEPDDDDDLIDYDGELSAPVNHQTSPKSQNPFYNPHHQDPSYYNPPNPYYNPSHDPYYSPRVSYAKPRKSYSGRKKFAHRFVVIEDLLKGSTGLLLWKIF